MIYKGTKIHMRVGTYYNNTIQGFKVNAQVSIKHDGCDAQSGFMFGVLKQCCVTTWKELELTDHFGFGVIRGKGCGWVYGEFVEESLLDGLNRYGGFEPLEIFGNPKAQVNTNADR